MESLRLACPLATTYLRRFIATSNLPEMKLGTVCEASMLLGPNHFKSFGLKPAHVTRIIIIMYVFKNKNNKKTQHSPRCCLDTSTAFNSNKIISIVLTKFLHRVGIYLKIILSCPIPPSPLSIHPSLRDDRQNIHFINSIENSNVAANHMLTKIRRKLFE